MSIKEAFFAVCSDAKPVRASYVSLYVNSPYYGGPEEGGWWGEDCKLVAYQICADDEEADFVQAKVCELAESLTRDAAKSFGNACLAQCEWLDARGLDSDYLPEVDGEESYFVAREIRAGSLSSVGCRHYE